MEKATERRRAPKLSEEGEVSSEPVETIGHAKTAGAIASSSLVVGIGPVGRAKRQRWSSREGAFFRTALSCRVMFHSSSGAAEPRAPVQNSCSPCCLATEAGRVPEGSSGTGGVNDTNGREEVSTVE